MYMGHFAIALGARRWLRPLPMAWLLFASIEPDLHDALGSLVPSLGIGPDTHTIPGACAAAIAIAVITALVFRGAGLALGAGALVLSHIAVDYLTSRLPLWRHGPLAGLHLYAMPWADFLLEASAIAIGVALYASSPDLRRPARAGVVSIAVLMLAFQTVWNFGLGSG
jgi:hypothetical protein